MAEREHPVVATLMHAEESYADGPCAASQEAARHLRIAAECVEAIAKHGDNPLPMGARLWFVTLARKLKEHEHA